MKENGALNEGNRMTDKRFVVEKYSVRDMSIDEKYVNSSYYIGDKGIAKRLCDLLNKLHEENQDLKQSFKEVLKELELTTFDKELLEKENEQLQIEKDTIQKQYSYELTKKLEYKSKMIDLKKGNKTLADALTVYFEEQNRKRSF